jgi:hypothetical protein
VIHATLRDARWLPDIPRRSRGVAAALAIEPSRLLAFGLLSYFVGLLFAPIVPGTSLATNGIILWISCAIAAFAGLAIGQSVLGPARLFRPDEKHMESVSCWVTTMGLAGVSLTVFDRYVLRGVPLDLNAFAVREALEASSPGAVGTIAAMLAAFAPLAYVTAGAAGLSGARVPAAWRRLAMLAPALFVLISLVQGSRSVMLVVVILHVIYTSFRRKYLGMPLKFWAVMGGVLLFLTVGATSATVMLLRLEQMGLDPMFSVQASMYAEAAQPSAAVLAWIDTHPAVAAPAAAVLSLCQYVFHGFFEFNALYSNYTDRWKLGAMTLWLPLKVVSQVVGTNLNVDTAELAGWRDGIFTTFVGPAFVDFGPVTPLMLVVLFAALGVPSRRLRAGDLSWLPCVCLVGCVAVLFPIVSLLAGASGAYLLFPSLAIGLVCKRRSFVHDSSR